MSRIPRPCRYQNKGSDRAPKEKWVFMVISKKSLSCVGWVGGICRKTDLGLTCSKIPWPCTPQVCCSPSHGRLQFDKRQIPSTGKHVSENWTKFLKILWVPINICPRPRKLKNRRQEQTVFITPGMRMQNEPIEIVILFYWIFNDQSVSYTSYKVEW